MGEQGSNAQERLSGVELTALYGRTLEVVKWIRELSVAAENMVDQSEGDEQHDAAECNAFDECDFDPQEHAESWLVFAADDLICEFKGLRRLFRRYSRIVTEASASFGNSPVHYGQFCAASAHESVVIVATWADDWLQRFGVVDPHGRLGEILTQMGEVPKTDVQRASHVLSRGLQGPIEAEQFISARLQLEYSKAQTILREQQGTDTARLSRPMSPKELVTRFQLSWDTLKKRIDEGAIRVKRLSSKSYRIHLDDLPLA